MKKLILLGAVVIILFGGFYVISNKDSGTQILSQEETISTQDNISWGTERVSNNSNDVPTYNLVLTIGDQSFDINDYWEEPLYGCRDFGTGRPADTQAPSESISDQLCYFMAGGDLFYVVKDEKEYQVLHKTISDGMPEQSAALLFKI